jgi:hypothetical protein
MTDFLLEFYVPRSDDTAVIAASDRARCAAAELRRRGTPVRYLRSIFVSEDETCFFVYEAESADNVRHAARLAGLPSARIVEAIASEAEGS